jgi:uncharacterized phage protein (TIGR01671 family)
MREIKFRVWVDGFLPEQAGMFYWVELYRPQPDGTYDRIYAKRTFESIDEYKFKSEEEPFTLMQYTGLVDKNGEEIYEGDIVEIQQPTSVNRGDISFREGAFAFTSQIQVDGNRTIVFLHSVKYQHQWQLEVIGNQYENGDLLK